MRSDRWLWVIVVLGSAVRLFGLGDRSLSYDECQQFWASQGSVLISNREITLDPPGFAALLHLHSLAAHHETWLRLLPCLLGILAIPAVYALALRVAGDPVTARAAALFFALAPYPIRYSQSLRVYSMTLLLGALVPALWLAALGAGVQRSRDESAVLPRVSWRLLGLLALLVFAGLLTMYGLLLLTLAILAATWAAKDLRDASWRARISLGLLAGVAAAAPFYAFSIPAQMSRGTPASFYDDKFLPLEGLPAAIGFLARGTVEMFGYFSFIVPVSGVLFGALALLGAARLSGRREGRATATVFALAVAAAAIGSGLRLYPFGGTRQMLYAAPLFYVFAAAGIMSLRAVARGALTGVLLLALAAGSGVFLVRYHSEPGGQEMRPVMSYLERHAAPGDRILVNKDAIPQFRFYYRGDPGAAVWGQETVIRDFTGEAVQLMAEHPGDRWWLVFSHGWSDERRARLEELDPDYRLADSIEAHRAGAYLLVPRRGGSAEEPTRPEADPGTSPPEVR